MQENISNNSDDLQTQQSLKKLTTGSILLAREVLKDPNFDSTVVLICVYSSEGSYGLVLNRPAHMPLSEIFDGFKRADIKREIFIGGPVGQEEMQVLQITDEPVEGSFQVAPKVYLGGQWEGIGHMIEADPVNTFLYLGYSGWGPSQLESEISAGAWDVYNVDVEKVLADGVIKNTVNLEELVNYLKKL